MCDGGVFSVPIATMLIGTVSAVAQNQAQQQQAAAQEEYQQAQAREYARVAELNNQAAIREYAEQTAAERMNQMQEQQAAAQQTRQVQVEALQKKGTMLASTNASGMALDYLMADYDRQEAERRDAILHQYEMASANADMTVSGYRDKAQNRVNSQQNYIMAPSSHNAGMNTLGTALAIGGSAIKAYGQYKYYDNKRKGIKQA
ncbi:MAG: hypothetical protein K2O70_05110 [Desulfovibrionaceae bacterium]|nr:hypothetical protein [Desulfovibrionaceae bacterium]